MRFVYVLGLGLVLGCAGRPVAPTQQSAPGLTIACVQEPDSDVDGLSDSCELLFAQAFAPELVVASKACNWDDSVEDGRLGGGYYFAVRRVDSVTVRIAYLPAYYEDCGWSGFKCNQPFIPCGGHSGDSEFIALDAVRSGDDVWRAQRVFLSSHCFDKLDDECRWFGGRELDRFEWVAGRYTAPVVWVADGKGAHYMSRSACDRAHLFYDTCDRNDTRMRFPIRSHRQNIGSSSRPAGDERGCVSWNWTGVVSAHVAPETYECFWNPRTPFRGWQRPASGGSTPYHKYLTEIAGF